MNRMLYAVRFFLFLFVAGCATTTYKPTMILTPGEIGELAPEKWRQTIFVNDVEGDPEWRATIGPRLVKTAIAESLNNAQFRAMNRESSTYYLQVELLSIRRVDSSVDYTVECDLRYILTLREGKEVVYDQTISTDAKVKFEDAVLGFQRTERSQRACVKANIQDFIDDLFDAEIKTGA